MLHFSTRSSSQRQACDLGIREAWQCGYGTFLEHCIALVALWPSSYSVPSIWTNAAGLDLLNQFGVADCSYDLTPEQLCEKIQDVDALIVRSATKVYALPTCKQSLLRSSG